MSGQFLQEMQNEKVRCQVQAKVAQDKVKAQHEDILLRDKQIKNMQETAKQRTASLRAAKALTDNLKDQKQKLWGLPNRCLLRLLPLLPCPCRSAHEKACQVPAFLPASICATFHRASTNVS